MAVIRDSVDERLRFGVGAAGGERQAGVVLFAKIPVGAKVKAYLDVPTELTTNLAATLAPGKINDSLAAQGYIFEKAKEPSFTAGGVAFRGRMRTLVTSGNGILVKRQEEPAWAAFGTSVTGSIKQKGKIEHEFQMPGGQSGDSNLLDEDRSLLRLRWLGTAVTGEALANSNGVANQAYSAVQAGGAAAKTKLAPGSIILHFKRATVATVARDDGRGRLVGDGVDGTIDYLSGKVTFVFTTAADNGQAVTLDYEHSCAYQPIDVTLEWDALQAQ